MKALILSANTGMGHNSSARAIQEAFESHGDVCDIIDGMLFLPAGASKIVSGVHVYVYQELPMLSRLGYSVTQKSESHMKEGSAFYNFFRKGVDSMRAYLVENEYDCVVCTHIFPAITLTVLMKEKPLPIHTGFLATDYTRSPGVEDTGLEVYFLPEEHLRDEFAQGGIDPGKMVFSGIPVRSEFYHCLPKEQARQMFHIPDSHPHLLMACGSMGAGPMEELAVTLAKRLTDNMDLTIVTGTNKKLRLKIDGRLGLDPRVHILGYVKNMPDLMDSADVYLTKPGGISVTESTVKKLPMVFVDAVSGCEEPNMKYFIQQGGGVTADTLPQIADTAVSLLQDPVQQLQMRQNLQRMCKGNAAECIYETMHRLCVKQEEMPQ